MSRSVKKSVPHAAVQNAQLPVPGQHRAFVWTRRIGCVANRADMQHIADSKDTGPHARESTRVKWRASEIERRIENPPRTTAR